METITNLLSALNITKNRNYDVIFELNNNEETNDNSETEYYNFIIKNNVEIKKKIDDFNNLIELKYDIYSNCHGCDLSLTECVDTLNYLLNRREIVNSIEKINTLNSTNFKQIIVALFSRIIVIHLEYFNKTNDIYLKYLYNSKMFEYAITYYEIFNQTIFKIIFDNFYKSLIYRAFYIASKEGCIISWLTFAKLAPDMINDDCYPKINKTTQIYKKINKEYLNNLLIFKKELEIFKKYNPDYNPVL